MSGGGYDSDYRSCGKTRKIDLGKPSLRVVTGRGTNSRKLGKGSMAVMCHVVIRFLVGKVTVPYDGVQHIPLYGLSAAGLRLLERISVEKHRSRVIKHSINCNNNVLLMLFRLSMTQSRL